MRGIYLGCLFYADDILLISSSVIELQKMLDICGDVGRDLGLKFNAKKSMYIIIGPNKMLTPTLILIKGAIMTWVDRVKYFGVVIVHAKNFTVDLSDMRRKFFVSVNSILSIGADFSF